MGIRNATHCISITVLVFVNTILLIGASSSSSVEQKKKINFTYESFTTKDIAFLKLEGSSNIHNGALQLTPDTLNDAFIDTHYNKSGRIMYLNPFKIWSSSSTASFNTTFVINIYRKEDWNAGHGLAFLIAPNYSIPDASFGQWLGLTNSSTDGSADNHILAIEFDTQKQDDIDDVDENHIGLNINSVRSNQSVSLDKYNNISLSPPPPGANYSVWIDYNGETKVMEVFIAREKDPKPQEHVLRERINLKDYLKQESYFGFAASTGDPHIELNCVLKWKLEIQDIRDEKLDDKIGLKIGVGVGVGVGVGGLILIIVILIGIRYNNNYACHRGSDDDDDEQQRADIGGKLKWLPREFKYKELKKATNNFDHRMKLGEGGFGIVYKGTLVISCENENENENAVTTTEIAVKKFSRDSIKSKYDFLAELTIIHRLRHKHLVRLLGWCYEKGKLLLVYDFMPNGSLEKHIYEQEDTLNWSLRCKVVSGVASALHYLHNEYDQKVIHRDLKASNILLDKDFNARLGDFGLARALESEKNSYAEIGLSGVPGTIGYVAPECFHTGRTTPESDVFGFGAVVLEVVCGKRPGIKIHHNQHHYSLVDWVWTLHREGRIQEAVDEKLDSNFVMDEAKKLLLLGLACSHPINSERPNAQTILQLISGALPPPHVPPFRPVFTWPSPANMDNTDSSLSLYTETSSRTPSVTKMQRTSSHLPV